MRKIKLTFDNYSSWAAYLAGASWLLYAYFFVVVKDPLFLNLFLVLGGLFAVKVFSALYLKLKAVFYKGIGNNGYEALVVHLDSEGKIVGVR